jgi:hypothetical protein
LAFLMSAELEKRIVAALADETATAAALGDLCATLEAAISDATAAADLAQAALLDPIAEPDFRKAQATVDSTRFVASRLKTLLPKLTEKHHEVAGAEAAADWRLRYDKLEIERNSVARSLRETYQAACEAIVSSLAAAADVDRRLGQLHATRPASAKGFLLGVELTARNLDQFSRDSPELTKALRLPDFSNSAKLAYPPPQASAGWLIASAIPTSEPRYSRDWAAHAKADNARRVAQEQQNIEREDELKAEARRVYERSL